MSMELLPSLILLRTGVDDRSIINRNVETDIYV